MTGVYKSKMLGTCYPVVAVFLRYPSYLSFLLFPSCRVNDVAPIISVNSVTVFSDPASLVTWTGHNDLLRNQRPELVP